MKKNLAFVSLLILLSVFLSSCNQAPNDEPVQSVMPSPTEIIDIPTPSPKITEIDTRDPDAVETFNNYFVEYCKNNDCSTPKPSVVPTSAKRQSFCYVEKDGSFYMSPEECQKLNDQDPGYFRRKAYENCKDGKNPEVTSEGDQRKADCSELFGLNY